MVDAIEPEPDERGCVIRVGQDGAGHWLAQESGGRMEGRFVSFAAAMGFARAERHAFANARVVVADRPLIPIVPFTPVRADERAFAAAA